MHLTNIISGQTLKTWTLHIVNDNRYEGTEDFQLRLSDPVLGILEYPFISNFFITDPEDGKFMQYMYCMVPMSSTFNHCIQIFNKLQMTTIAKKLYMCISNSLIKLYC